MGCLVILHVLILHTGFIGHEGGSPYLTMRVRVGAAHYRALILEYLNPPVFAAQFHHLLHPGVNDSLDLHLTHTGQSHVRLGTEAHDSTDSPGTNTSEEWVLSLLRFRYLL